MHTLGYSFSPWEDARAIADGPSILSYVTETARAPRRHGQDPHRPRGASAPSTRAPMRAGPSTSGGPDSGETQTFTCAFLFCCGGYYRYDAGYTPDFAGVERFPGPVVHPQHWPEDLDYAGKRVVVIGSGATAVTLVPAMARDGRARDHAPALADLRRVAALARWRGRVAAPPAAQEGRLPARARQERGADDALLPAQPPPAQPHEVDHPPGRAAPAARRLRRRHPFPARLQPVGPAPVRRPRR